MNLRILTIRSLQLWAVIAVTWCGQCTGQTTSSSPKSVLERPTVRPSDGQLAHLFLHFYSAVTRDIRLMPDTAIRVASEKFVASEMGLNVTDFRAIESVSSEIGTLLAAVDAEGRAYRQQVAKGEDVAHREQILRIFDKRQTEILVSVRERLRGKLSSDGWQALMKFIDGPFQEKVTISNLVRR